ncbi:DJ-1/PfpI family protein, partial [Pseudomonas sp. NPDC089569]
EYAPAPPFQAGSPETAPAHILEEARKRAAGSSRQRAQITERAAAKLDRH